MNTALLFSGQGAQQVSMGKSLYDNIPEVKELWDLADDNLGFDLLKIVFEGPEEALTETRVCQPALYVHGYSIFKALQSSGAITTPTAALGLSLGELTAHAAANTYDFLTGLRIVAARGALMQQACELTKGGMTSLIGGSMNEVHALCKEFDIDVANLNCPGQTVISGLKDSVLAATEKAQSLSFKRAISLNVAGAYHSRLMQPAANSFKDFLSDITFKTPSCKVFTNTTGKEVSSSEEIKEALVKQVTSSVRWEDCMRSAAELSIDKFYECGPGKVLAGLARRTEKEWQVTSISEFQDLDVVSA